MGNKICLFKISLSIKTFHETLLESLMGEKMIVLASKKAMLSLY